MKAKPFHHGIASTLTLGLAAMVLACPLPRAWAEEKDRPAIPENTNFKFVRGVVQSLSSEEERLLVRDDDGRQRSFILPEEAAFVNSQGKPVDRGTVKPGADVTVTVMDPFLATAVSRVHQVVVAKPLSEKAEAPLRGVVLKQREAANAVTLRPDGEEAKALTFLYNEGETEFVGGDGLEVDEEQVQAGDRLMVFIARQEDGGLMAERIIFLDGSGQPGDGDDLDD